MIERQQAETALRESEERFKAITVSAKDSIIMLDTDGNVCFWNPAAEQLTGYPADEIMGRNFHDLIVPSRYLAEHRNAFAHWQKTGLGNAVGKTLELSVMRKDGIEVPVELSLSSSVISNQQYAIGTVRDITERKRIEDALRQSEQEFMDVLHASGDAILLIDGDTFVDCNEATAQMLGYPNRVDFLMTHPSELSPPRQPDGQSSFEKANEMMQLAVEKGFHRFEWIHRKANGEDFPVEVSLTPVVHLGKMALHCVWRDITERKRAEGALRESEGRLRDVIFSVADWVWEVDQNCAYTYSSQKGFELLGRSREEVIGKTPFDFMPPDEARKTAAIFSEIMANRAPIQDLENWNIRKNGERICLLTNGVPILDKDGNLKGYRGVDQDITERKRAEEERERIRSWQAGVDRILESVLAQASLDQKLKIITDGVVETFGADFCRIWLIEKGDLCNTDCMHAEVAEGPHACRFRDTCLHLKASSGRYTQIDGKEHGRVPFGAYKIGRIASGEETRFLTNDVEHDPRVHDHAWAKNLGLVAFAGYRLKPPDSDVLGVFGLFARFPISPDMDAILDGLSRAISLAIQKDLADTAMRDSEERFRTIVDQSPLSMVVMSPDGRTLQVNSAFVKLWGVTLEDIKDYNPLKDEQLTHLGIMPYIQRGFSGEAVTYPPLEYDGVKTQGFGDKRWVQGHIYPVRDAAGTIRNVILVHEDVTERKLAEENKEKKLLRQQGISQLRQSLLAPASLEDSLRKVTDAIVRLFDADFCRIWLIRRGDLCERGCIHAEVKDGPHVCRHRDRCLHLLTSSGRYTHVDGQGHRRVPFGCYKIGLVASGEENKFVTNDAQNDPRVHNHAWVRELGLVSFAGYQLRAPGGETLGVLALFAKHPISVDEDAILEGIGSTVALVVKQAVAEGSLHRSETKFRTLYDSTSDAVMLLGEKGFFDCNKATLAIFGCATSEEFCSKHPADLSPSEQPCGTDSFTLANQQIATAMEKGSNRFEWIHKRVDTGEPFYAEVLLNAMELDGKPVVQAVVRDITERKRVEDALRASETEHRMLFENAGVGIAYYDLEGRVLMLNALAAAQIGGKPEDFVGRAMDEILPPEVAIAFHASVDRLSPANASIDSEEMIPSSTGPRWYFAKHTGIFEPNGVPIGVQIITTDITDRKRAEDELRKLSQAVEQSPTSVVITDVQGNIEYVNPKFSEITGYSSAEAIGQNPRILKSDLTPKETYDQMWSAIGAGLSWKGELRNRKKNGELFWERANIFAIKDSAGKTTHYIGLEEDITEQKLVEEERSRFISVIDEAPESIAILNADGTIMYVNQVFEKMSGALSSRTVGLHFEVLMREISANEFYSVPWDAVRTGESWTQSITYRGSDGGFHLIDQSISPIRSQSGEITNYTVFGRDVTEERELEIRARWADERLRLSIDGMVDGLTLWDVHMGPDGSIQEFVCSEANPAALRMLGKERQVMLGHSVQELMTGQKDYDLHDLFKRVLDKGQPAIIEHVHILRNEDRVVLTIHVWAIGTGVACHMHDVTQRLDLEAQLRQAQKLEAVGSLAAGIAHEINTPIQFVGDNIRFLADSFSGLMNVLEQHRVCREKMASLPGESEELQQLRDLDKEVDVDYLKTEIPLAVEQSLEGVSRVSTIVRAMKDFSHIDEREMVLADINQMLDTTLTVARNELKYVADVTKGFAPDLPTVECFRNDLNQVFLNLLINAAHAIGDVVSAEGQGRGTITVATRRDGDEVVVSISDTGGGIPEGIRDRIFDHFFTTKEVGKGTGQGLSIARSIVVEKHKGAITFDSEIGKGTTFYIRLPITRKEVEHAESQHPVRG
jgi:two-component system, NtrC family, sensor kinase